MNQNGNISLLFAMIIGMAISGIALLYFSAEQLATNQLNQERQNQLQIRSMQACDQRLLAFRLCAWSNAATLEFPVVNTMSIALPDVFLLRVQDSIPETERTIAENIWRDASALFPISADPDVPRLLFLCVYQLYGSPIHKIISSPIENGLVTAKEMSQYTRLIEQLTFWNGNGELNPLIALTELYAARPYDLLNLLIGKVALTCGCDLREMMTETRVIPFEP